MADETPGVGGGSVPTLQTVALAAQVSVSTASRALRNDPKISRATRARVQAVAARLHYRPNPYLSVLMTHLRQTRPTLAPATLVWLDRSPDPQAWRRNHIQAGFYQGGHARAEALGFRLERLACADPRMSRARLTDVLRARGIHGILCSADRPDVALLGFPIDVSTFAVASVGCRFVTPDLHFSMNDQFATAALGCRRLWELGYRRIGLLTSRRLEAIVDHRFIGGYMAAWDQLAPGQPPSVFDYDAGTPQRLAEWVQRQRLDALLAAGQEDACAYVRTAGWRVPQDLAVAVLDWHPGLSGRAGVCQNHARVGAAAVDLVVRQIHANEFGAPAFAQGVLVESEWREGESAPRASLHRRSGRPPLPRLGGAA